MRFLASILILLLPTTVAVAQQGTGAPATGKPNREQRVNAAVSAANANLRQQVLQVSVGDHLHVSDLLNRPSDLADLDQALQSAQPVGGTRWINNEECQVRLEISASKVSDVLLKVADDPARQPVISSNELRKCVSHWKRARFCAAGSSESVSTAVPTSLPSTVLPLTPPDWVDQQLQAVGSARGEGSRLKLARAAEAKAAAELRNQFLSLHIDDHSTLGDAAKSDSDLDEAIDRSLLQAKTFHVDYLSDGSVTVRVSLDLQDAWDQLRR